ncbi:MAG: fibronectin type III domain-containing protein [Gemmatimonadales bacterium]|nr:fibronectin type III domain-containing protein [Gemmatimonadales bacterium]
MMFGTGSTTRTALLLGLALLAGCSEDSNPVLPPANVAPTGLTATATGQTTIRVTWTAPTTAATQFVLQRATGAAGAFAEVARPAAGATQYDDAGLTLNTQYRYRLAAVRAAGTSAFSAEASATTQSVGLIEVTTDITTNTTWTAANVYRIKGFRKVASGATLTIEAGTKIEGDFATVGSSLFVLRGARIVANGTAQAPIVFTSSQAVGSRQPGDWGGLVIIGNGLINRSGAVNIEGTGTSADNPLQPYSGGANNADNSGRLSYVRVEYAGFGPAQDAELNSFTIAAVGSGTVIDHLEALNGLDDHYEFFGGAVDAKYLVSYQAGDDHFDMSEGYQGRLQFLIGYQSKILIPRAGAGNVSGDPQGIENDGCNGSGCDLGMNSTPFTIPVVANFTLVGTGPGVVGASGGYGAVLRRGTGGHYVNGILARWPSAAIGYRDAASKTRETDGFLSLKGLYVADAPVLFQAGQQTYGGPAGDVEYSAATATGSLFTKFPTAPTAVSDFDWALAAGVAPRTGGTTTFTGDLLTRATGSITGTAYRGAADPAGAKWWEGWTSYSNN